MLSTTTYIVLKELAGNLPPTLSITQMALAPHAPALIIIWKLILCATLLALLVYVAREYRATGR